MKLQQVHTQTSTELECLAEEIRKLRVPGRNLRLPDDLKFRIVGLRQAGMSIGAICRATGIQPASLQAWSQRCRPEMMPRPFRVVTLEEDSETTPASQTLIFRFASGKVTVDVPVSALSPELLRVLISC
jgi:transposase-like protein